MKLTILLFFVVFGAGTWLYAQDSSFRDTEGHFINAHGAGILFHQGIYYLFGEIKKGKTRLVPGQDWEDYRVPAGGVSCYTSRDLVHWRGEGVALAPDTTDPSSELHTSKVIERPKVIYNSGTGKFVMWMHVDKDDYSYAHAGVAISDRPEGPYRYLGSSRPNGQMSRDMTVFRDDDGKAYLVYTSENNNTMQVCLLSDDYLSLTGKYTRILVGQRREAPALFKYDKKYYLITSLCSGWDPNAADCVVADSMMGEWRSQGNPCAGPDSATTFHSQSSFVLPLPPGPARGDGTSPESDKGHFLFMADRWNKTDLERSGYCWLPLRVKEGKVTIRDNRLLQRETAPLSLVSYSVRAADAKDSTSYSFIRFYDADDHVLLEYKAPFTVSGDSAMSGNYTEAPPFTKYLRIGTGRDAGDLRVQLDIRIPAVLHAPLCNIDEYLRPFWNTDTIVNETVLLLASGRPSGGASGPEAAKGRLLFTPARVLSVKSYGLDTVFKKGADYTLQGRTITRTAWSHMSFRTDSSFDRQKDLAWYDLQSQWVVVTYTHHDKWKGMAPAYQGDRIPRLVSRLRSHAPVTIVAYGMSITRGMDVSGYDGVPPYMPGYMDLFLYGLKRQFGYGDISLHNAGLPGATVSWGAANAGQYINPLRPDLVVLDFGMNDFWTTTPPAFKAYIRTIIDKVRESNPDVEFLLVGNMQFDPGYVLDSDRNKAWYTGNLQGYVRVLRELAGPGIAVLDMTTLSGPSTGARSRKTVS